MLSVWSGRFGRPIESRPCPRSSVEEHDCPVLGPRSAAAAKQRDFRLPARGPIYWGSMPREPRCSGQTVHSAGENRACRLPSGGFGSTMRRKSLKCTAQRATLPTAWLDHFAWGYQVTVPWSSTLRGTLLLIWLAFVLFVCGRFAFPGWSSLNWALLGWPLLS